MSAKLFFDVCKIYNSAIVIGIIAPSLNYLTFRARLDSLEIKTGTNLFIDKQDKEISLLSSSKYWYFNIPKKHYKALTNSIELVNVFTNDKNEYFAVILPKDCLPLTIEIKRYDHIDHIYNHTPVDNDLKQIIDSMISLSMFCAKDDHRQSITNVWTYDKGIHATDGSHGMINYLDIPDQYKDISISKNDLNAIKLAYKVDSNLIIHIVNYMNNTDHPDQITEKKLSFSSLKHKFELEIDHIPYHSRPALEKLISEDLKDRKFSFTLKDLKEIKKQLLFFKKSNTQKDKDLLVRLDLTNRNIILSDKDMFLERHISLESNNATSCLLSFKVDYLLNMISYCIDMKYSSIELLWKHDKKNKILDPVLIKGCIPGKHVSLGVLMPVQVRDNSFYDLPYKEYKQYRKDQLTL